MSETVEQLEPCPCGAEPSLVFASGGYDCEFIVKCRACGRTGEGVPATIVEVLAFGDWFFEGHKQQAAEAWNESIAAGLLVDDSAAWCELGPVAFGRGDATRTEITLEDMG